jgi:transcriptional regulator with XRE-family HTH domain
MRPLFLCLSIMESRAEKTFLNNVAHRLAQLRLEKNLTQAQLAANSGLDRVAIANIETGVRRPTVTTIHRLTSGMGIKAEDVFRGL